MYRIRASIIGAVAALLLSPGSTIWAGTPDGATPANEGVCDVVKGGTPALYGLCLAFSEAQDCVPDLSAEDPVAHCQPSAQKLLDLYNSKKQPGDPDMPGVYAPCSCWTTEDVVSLPSSATGQCRTAETTDSADIWLQFTDSAGQTYTMGATSDGTKNKYTCSFVGRSADGKQVHRYLKIAPDQYPICASQVEDKAFELSINCGGDGGDGGGGDGGVTL